MGLHQQGRQIGDSCSIAGKAKFVNTPGNRHQDTKLGYVIDIALAPVDESAKQEKPATNENAEAKKSSPEVMAYDIIFYFIHFPNSRCPSVFIHPI